jgi:cysteine synthase
MDDLGLYLNSWDKWPLPVVQISQKLNPLKKDKVNLYAVLAFHLPYENIKFITLYGLLSGTKEKGVLKDVHTLIEATSGNTGIVLSEMAKNFGNFKVKLVVANDIPDGKRYPLLMSGAQLISPEEGLSGIATARKLGGGGWKEKDWKSDNGCLNLDQYANPDGAKIHAIFTAPKIIEQMECAPNIFVAGIGTGGTMVGISEYVKKQIKNVKTVGVLLENGNEIPGVRDLNRMKEITLPWKESCDEIVEIKTKPSYLASLWFNWTMSITPGPSSGFAYLGALKALKKYKDSGELDNLRNEKGEVNVAILFPDGNRPYGERYTANLPYEYFSHNTAPLPWNMPGDKIF